MAIDPTTICTRIISPLLHGISIPHMNLIQKDMDKTKTCTKSLTDRHTMTHGTCSRKVFPKGKPKNELKMALKFDLKEKV